LKSLDWATDARSDHRWLLYLLPLAGLLVGLIYQSIGGRVGEGNNLILDEIHEPSAGVPRRMAPLIYGATVVTHLFGGSAGREGTAVQMSGSLTDASSRLLRLNRHDRRLMLIAAIGGGFGAVFGVPVAGCVFALEIQSMGRMRYDALAPALVASLVGDRVVHGLGVHHMAYPTLGEVDLTFGLLWRILLAGLAFGLTATAFVQLTHRIKHWLADHVDWAPWRPFFGGLAVITLTGIVGSRDYLGLSTALIAKSFAGGVGVIGAAFALKLLFTATTLGSGFYGGEVTPLFVIGATLGCTLGNALHTSVPLFTALGFVAVFAAAANTPLACTVMGVELFGGGAIVPLALACVTAYLCSGAGGIYTSQRMEPADWGRPADPAS
jgi:H+/Cl- antiporter ClcA